MLIRKHWRVDIMVLASIKNKFLVDARKKAEIAAMLEEELKDVLIGNITIQKSPVETRIFIETFGNRRIFDKKSPRMQRIIERIKSEYGLENPVITEIEIKEPWLEPKIVAKKVARAIEKGEKVKAVLNRAAKSVMDAGAMGVEIIASGKLGAKGSRSKSIKVSLGFVPKAGDVARYVGTYDYAALTKPGVIGISVRIARKELARLIKPEIFEKEEKQENEEKENNWIRGG